MNITWPVGTPDERSTANDRLPGGWTNSNPFANHYEIQPGVWNYHDGVDLNLNVPVWNSDWHKAIVALADGVVTFAGKGGGTWGSIIDIKYRMDDGKFFVSRYGHVENALVKQGEVVVMGQQVASVGTADGQFTAHLHWNISQINNRIMLDSPNQWCGTSLTCVTSNYVDPIEFIVQTKKAQPPMPTMVLDNILDLSHYNLITDGAALKTNVSAIIHKATQGLTYVDPEYAGRKTLLKDAVLWGAYHFGTAQDPIAQANHFIDVVGPNSDTLLALDFESNSDTDQGTMSVAQAEAFVTEIKRRTGVYPLLYLRASFAPETSLVLSQCPLWISSYRDIPLLPNMANGKYVLHQYTNGTSGPAPRTTAGLNKPCDRSRFVGTKAELALFWKTASTAVATPAPTPVPVPVWPMPLNAQNRGVHTSAGGWSPLANHLELITRNQVKTALLMTYNGGVAITAIPAYRKAGITNFILRPEVSHRKSNAKSFVAETLPNLREYVNVIGSTNNLMIQIGNEPNLFDEGLTDAAHPGGGWTDGAGFAKWWIEVATEYRKEFPGCKLGFAAMSPGGNVAGVRMDEIAFVSKCAAAIDAADWISVHNYWQKSDGSDISLPLVQWKKYFGIKPIVATEVGPTADMSVGAIVKAYDAFAAAEIPCIIWILDGTKAFDNADWGVHNVTLPPVVSSAGEYSETLYVATTSTLRLRSLPSTTGVDLGSFNPGTMVKATTSDKVPAGGYLWRKVSVPSVNLKGWMAEAKLSPSEVYLTSTPPSSSGGIPPVTPPAKTRIGSRMSLHILPGANTGMVLDLLRTTLSAGKPLAGALLVKAGWGGELTVNGVKSTSPNTEVMLRRWDANWENETQRIDWSIGNLKTVGYNMVKRYHSLFIATDPDAKLADFHQFINEPSYGVGTSSFWEGAMDAASELNIKLAIGCWSVANPPLPNEPGGNIWNSLYPMLRRARVFGHAFMLHQYILPDPSGEWNNEWGIMRHHQLYAQFPADLKDLPVRFGEFGTAYAATNYSTNVLIAGFAVADEAMKNDDQVKWAAAWTAGNMVSWKFSELEPHMAGIKNYLISHA